MAFFPNIDAIQEFKIESNSPPAEFGRFNGGVVNLTTKSGSNAFRGTAVRVLPPRSAERPEFLRLDQRRSSRSSGAISSAASSAGRSGATATFFFVDYQGQRQTIGRTVISTVPTVLQRQGIFTEAIGGRVPAIYDPGDDDRPAAARRARRFPGNTIPAERFDPVAGTLLERYPLPTSAGTANNFRRVADERVDQDQFSVRIDQRAVRTAGSGSSAG